MADLSSDVPLRLPGSTFVIVVSGTASSVETKHVYNSYAASTDFVAVLVLFGRPFRFRNRPGSTGSLGSILAGS